MCGMGRWFVIDGLAEMGCDGGMIAMISLLFLEGMGLLVCHKYIGTMVCYE